MEQTDLEKEIANIPNNMQEEMLANVRKYQAEQKAKIPAKLVRNHILANMIKHTTFTDKETGKLRKSDKPDLDKLCNMLNDCDPESPIKFKFHWKVGLFVDYGISE